MILATASQPAPPASYGINIRNVPCVYQIDINHQITGKHVYNPLLNTLGPLQRVWRGERGYRGVLFASLDQAKDALVHCLNPSQTE